ncbi:MAG: polysaccharide deacetylase family protein [Nitrosopumilaceae archaeon]
MKFKTKQNLILIFTPLVSILTILLVIQSIIPSYAEEFGQLNIDVRYTNGDRASTHNIIMKIYDKATNELYTQLKPNSDYPYFVALLPIEKEFRIDAYVNGMFSGSYNIDIKNKHEEIDFTIPLSSGIKFQVLYDDKYTPIEGAIIQIKNHKGDILRNDFTDKNGKSLRFWTAPTILKDNYYEVEISIAENIIHKYSPLILNPGERKDLKIVTPWPKIIESPVTIQVLKQNMLPITSADGKYVAELYDKENNKVAKSNINIHGEAKFALIPLGDYRILIKNIHEGLGTFFVNQTITLENNSKKIQVIGDNLFLPKLETTQKDIGFVQQGVDLDLDIREEKTIPSVTKKLEFKKLSCNCVAFRFDDVQDHWLNDVQIGVLDVFKSKNLPVTVGIIGDRIGNDEKIISYINSSMSNGSIEIANHGWQHEDFTTHDKKQQNFLIQKTNKKIQDLFGILPSVFIPPFNSYNENTTQVMLENGITHYSSEFDFSTPPYPLVNAELYNFPEGAVTGELTPNKDFIIGVSHKLTLSQIMQSIDEYGFAVVTMHPQEFSEITKGKYSNQVNEKQIRELELLLERLRFEEIKIVPLGEINLDSNQNNSIPKWIKNAAELWHDGIISDSDFKVVLKFLVEKNIIPIQNIPNSSEQESKEIPFWIRNSVGWWSEGKISDDDFVLGVEYFVENGIIRI